MGNLEDCSFDKVGEDKCKSRLKMIRLKQVKRFEQDVWHIWDRKHSKNNNTLGASTEFGLCSECLNGESF